MIGLDNTDGTFILMTQPRLRTFHFCQLSGLILLPLSLLPINPVMSLEQTLLDTD
jgi:hypothetical protein